MVPLWRLFRNQYGRAAYEVLGRAGVTATVMYEYVRCLNRAQFQSADDGAEITAGCDPDEISSLDPPVSELQPDEMMIGAFVDESPAGYLFLSTDVTHEIHPLERTLTFDGAYLRRVFVDPDHRSQGIATRLVSTACERARKDGADRATALVALDNVPSRSLFTGLGFEPRKTRRYVRVGPVSHRAIQPV